MFPQYFAVSHMGNIVSSVRFLFQDADYAYAKDHVDLGYTAENFNKNPSMRALTKICEHRQASSHLILRAIRAKAKFCEHVQIGRDHSIPQNTY